MKKGQNEFILPGLDQKTLAQLLEISDWQCSQWKQGNRLLPRHAVGKMKALLAIVDIHSLRTPKQALPIHPHTHARWEKWLAIERLKNDMNQHKIRKLTEQLNLMKGHHQMILQLLQHTEEYLNTHTQLPSDHTEKKLCEGLITSCLEKLQNCDELAQEKLAARIRRLGL